MSGRPRACPTDTEPKSRSRWEWRPARATRDPRSRYEHQPRLARSILDRGPGATSHLELLVHAPAAGDPRYPTYLVLDAVLAGGKAEGRAAARAGSRLHAALVRSGLAQAVSTEVELSEYPGLHAVSVTAAPDADLARIESSLDAALAAAARDVSDDEVRAAADQVVTAFTLRDDSNRAIADRLARFEGIGSYTLLPRIVGGVGRVTAAEVRTLAAALFDADRHNVGWFVPQAAPADTTAGDAETPAQRAAPAAIAQRHAGTAVPPPATTTLRTPAGAPSAFCMSLPCPLLAIVVRRF